MECFRRVKLVRVLHIINSLDIGGAESLLAGLLEYWADEHHVVVLQKTGPFEKRVRDAAASVSFVGASKSSKDLIKMVKGVQRVVDQVRPDILHSHLVHSDLVSLAIRARGARRVTSIHVESLFASDPIRSRMIAHIVGRLSGSFSMAIATSDRSLGYLEALHYRCPRSVVNNGTPIVDRVYFDPDRVVFLSLARFSPTKGHSVLMRAFLMHLNSYPESKLLCAGAGVDLANPEFLAVVRSLGDLDIAALPIDFAGPQLDITGLFAEASALVISSSSETFPMVGSESCMHGVPVITTDVGGAKAFALRKQLLVEPGSVTELANAMNYFAQLSAIQRTQLSDESRQKALDQFDIRLTGRAYEAVYCSVLPDTTLRDSRS
jgi:glycosyltransferase involved in cell wall biosynthesis